MSETIAHEVLQQPSLEADFVAYEQQLVRLETDTINAGGSGEYPEWVGNDWMFLSQLSQKLKEDNVDDPEYINRYYQILDKDADLRAHISGNKRFSSGVVNLIDSLGADIVGGAIGKEDEDGPLHKALLDTLTSSIDDKSQSLGSVVETLCVANGLDTPTELLGITGSEYSDSIRSFMQTERGIATIKSIAVKHDSDSSFKERLQATYEWAAEAVSAVSGLDKKEAQNYVFSATRTDQTNEVLKVINAFEYFGTERVLKISEMTGIHGLESYSIEQLERMERFANAPDELADELKNHDVTVVMINRFGDHNSVMSTIAETYEDGDRTLFFEISKMDDIYRRFSRIKNAGISPSVFVVAAHGGKDGGRVFISDERDQVNKRSDIASVGARRFISAYNESSEAADENVRAFSMHGMKGFSRLVEEYMQPSKGVEDQDEGRKKIIFSSCYTGVEAKVTDKSENGDNINIGMESIISQLGNDLVESGFKGDLDIYGAPDGIQMKRSGAGVVYTGREIEYDTGRSKLHAEVVTLENGSISKNKIDEIPLYKK